MKTHIDKKSFIQINIVVADIETAAEKWADLLGVEKPEICHKHLETSDTYEYQYHNQPTPCELKTCDIQMDGWVLELHQPCGGQSSFQDFLDKHGNGVHHIGFEVGDKRDVIISEMAEDGYDVNRTMGVYPGSSWTIVDGEDTLGVNLNIKPKR